MQAKLMKKLFAIFLAMVMMVPATMPVFAKGATVAPDGVVYVNGNIYTEYVPEVNTNNNFKFWGPSGTFEKASVMAIKDGKFAYVGDSQIKAMKALGNKGTIVDLGGQTVIPGIIESHMHFMSEGTAQSRIDIFWKTKPEIIAAVGAEAERLAARGEPKTTWIVSGGWVDTLDGWTPATAAELDAVSQGYPVYLSHASGHGGWANTAAMEAAGIDTTLNIGPDGKTMNPVGGTIIRDSSGNATGLFQGGPAGSLVSRAQPPSTTGQRIDAIYSAQEECFSYGITTAMDAGSGVETIDLLKSLYQDTKAPLKIRLYEEISANTDDPSKGSDVQFRDGNGGTPEIGSFNDRLTIRVAKAFMDGAMGSRTATMIEPYEPYIDPGTGELKTDNYGEPRVTEENIEQIIRQNLVAGFSVSAHAIGDKANHVYIEATDKVQNELRAKYKDTKPAEFKGTLEEWKAWISDPRIRSEHFQFVSMLPNGEYANDIEKAIAIGMTPSMQFIHATSDMNGAEPRIGGERIKGAYAWRKILNANGIIANGTDASVELLNPFHGLYAGLTRQFRETGGSPAGAGTPGGDNVGWYEEECLSINEALAAYTIWGAYANFQEDSRGSIEVGKLGDFAVLDRDIIQLGTSKDSTDNRKIINTEVQATVLGGELVFGELDATPLKAEAIIKINDYVETLDFPEELQEQIDAILMVADADIGKEKDAKVMLAIATKAIQDVNEVIAADKSKKVQELYDSKTAAQNELMTYVQKKCKSFTAKSELDLVLDGIIAINSATDKAGVKKALADSKKLIESIIIAKAAKPAKIKVKSKSKKLSVSWSKVKGVTGYQVVYKLKGASKYKTMKTTTALKVTSKKLKKGKKYTVKVRPYTIIKGKKIYGKYSKAVTVRCK